MSEITFFAWHNFRVMCALFYIFGNFRQISAGSQKSHNSQKMLNLYQKTPLRPLWPIIRLASSSRFRGVRVGRASFASASEASEGAGGFHSEPTRSTSEQACASTRRSPLGHFCGVLWWRSSRFERSFRWPRTWVVALLNAAS